MAPQARARAGSLLLVGRVHEAIEIIEDALATSPYDADWLITLSVARLALGEHTPALEAADQAVASQWSNPLAHRSRGKVLTRLGRYDDAKDALKTSLSLDPESAASANAYVEVIMNEAADHPAAADPDVATELHRFADLALSLSPEDVESHASKVFALTYEGRHAEAEPRARSMLALDPERVRSLHLMAVLHEQLGQPHEAAEIYLAAMRKDPRSQAVNRLTMLNDLVDAARWRYAESVFVVVAIMIATTAGLVSGSANSTVTLAILVPEAVGGLFMIWWRNRGRGGLVCAPPLRAEIREIVQRHAEPGQQRHRPAVVKRTS